GAFLDALFQLVFFSGFLKFISVFCVLHAEIPVVSGRLCLVFGYCQMDFDPGKSLWILDFNREKSERKHSFAQDATFNS
ncbi:MAG: hypothetical protein P8Y16_04190, partial [Sulfurimonas sp.]